MKKTILIVLLLSFGFSQKLSEVIETYENGNIKSITYHKETQNGIEKVKYKEYRKNGTKREEETFKNGEKDGLWTSWYENGNKKRVENYKDGKSNSQNCWDEDGDECECSEYSWEGCK